VRIEPTYDRSGLINDSLDTLRRTLIEEAIVVSIVIIIFLFHLRSALVPIIALPIAVAASFIPMYYLGVSANIMSPGGVRGRRGVARRRDRLWPTHNSATLVPSTGVGGDPSFHAGSDGRIRVGTSQRRRCESRDQSVAET
jgi:hypothetical protein